MTHGESAARRAADVIIILMLCAAAVFILFKLILVPVATNDPQVSALDSGELVIVDRVSKYFSEYAPGDIVRAKVGGSMNAYRVAAPQGSSVAVRGGRLYVNGGLMDDSAYAGGWQSDIDIGCEVPYGSLLLLPDDRSGVTELDSYVVPIGSIYGKLRFRIYPFSKFNMFI